MEVSSPGLGRTLKKDKHLEKSLGEAVEFKTYKPVDGSKEFAGILRAYDKDTVTIAEPEEEAGQDEVKERIFKRADIAIIRLALDI